jgi:hypothetical protein
LIGNGRIARYQRQSTPVTKAGFSHSVFHEVVDERHLDNKIKTKTKQNKVVF